MIRVAKLTEKAFQAQVVQLAKLRGWKVYHTYDSRRSVHGFPDLILLRGARCIAAEIKVGKNKPTPEQHEWLAAFAMAAIEEYVWRPENWDKIVEILA